MKKHNALLTKDYQILLLTLDYINIPLKDTAKRLSRIYHDHKENQRAN